MKIFLMGLPGSGKSTLGKQLAQHLALPFIDLDEVIEQTSQRSIRIIFADEGEEVFRQLEQQALHYVIMQQEAFILATGGGTPCFYDNMEVMNQAGITFYLDVPISIIIQRMQEKQIANRPLLRGMNVETLEQEFKAKFAHRLPVYQQAKYTLRHPIDVAHTVQLIRDVKTRS